MLKLNYTVLIVEDDLEEIEKLDKAAGQYPFFKIIKETNSERVAWKTIEEKQPDFIIVDDHLFEGDGFHLVEKIRETYKYTDYYPFISVVSSALVNKVTKERYSELADDMWTKNNHYDANRVFGSFLSKTSRDSKRQHRHLDALKTSPLKKLILTQLNEYSLSKKSKKNLNLVSEVFVVAMEQPLKLNSLEKACKQIAQLHQINHNTVKSHFSEFVSDIFNETDKKVLCGIFANYRDSTPSPSDFFNEFLYETRNLIDAE